MAEDGPGVWLTLAELAARSGRDRMAVRSWVRRRERNGLARTRRGNQGQTQVWATPELLAELTDRSGRGPTRDQTAGPTPGPAEAWPPDELAALREELGESRELAARTAGELAAEQRRNAELVETLTAALAKAEAAADRLEAELAEARRPWLARVLEGLRRKGS